jgi:thiol-disulfide isomerase/thioredoxin
VNRALPLVLLALGSGVAGFLLYHGLVGGPATHGRRPPSLAGCAAGGGVRARVRAAGPHRRAALQHEWDDTIRVVNFWATWCPPCIREIPLLVEIQREYADRACRSSASRSTNRGRRRVRADFDFNYPVLIGQEDAMDLGNQFLNGFIGLPFTAFTDRSGRILRVHSGEIHREQIEAILAELL